MQTFAGVLTHFFIKLDAKKSLLFGQVNRIKVADCTQQILPINSSICPFCINILKCHPTDKAHIMSPQVAHPPPL